MGGLHSTSPPHPMTERQGWEEGPLWQPFGRYVEVPAACWPWPVQVGTKSLLTEQQMCVWFIPTLTHSTLSKVQ